jgi:hypothetical protein
MGPRKRGKSWFLMEASILAVLQGLRVAFFSLEMSDTGFGMRVIKRITSLCESPGLFYYPVFDCAKNQDGTCRKSERVNSIRLFERGKESKPKPEFAPKGYRICDICRGTDDFIVDTWWVGINRDKLTFDSVVKNIEGFETMYGFSTKFRLMVYPAMRANLRTIESDLDKAEEFDGFVPDMIVIDYADILKPEVGQEVSIESTGQTWMSMKGLASDRKCIVLTATQTSRKSGERINVKGTDVAWDIRKMDHVDLAYALSQVPREKERGMIRVSVPYFRWGECSDERKVTVLQNLKMGQSLLDSEFGAAPLDDFEDED